MKDNCDENRPQPSWHVREWTATRWRSDYVLDLPYAI